MEYGQINFHQAMQNSNSQKSIVAMNEEIKSIKDNDIWKIFPSLGDEKPIGCKWK